LPPDDGTGKYSFTKKHWLYYMSGKEGGRKVGPGRRKREGEKKRGREKV